MEDGRGRGNVTQLESGRTTGWVQTMTDTGTSLRSGLYEYVVMSGGWW